MHLVAGGGPFSFGSGIDLAIRRNDFSWPEDFHAAFLFAEKVGPVCHSAKVAAWFTSQADATALQAEAPRLHTRTRRGFRSLFGQCAP